MFTQGDEKSAKVTAQCKMMIPPQFEEDDIASLLISQKEGEEILNEYCFFIKARVDYSDENEKEQNNRFFFGFFVGGLRGNFDKENKKFNISSIDCDITLREENEKGDLLQVHEIKFQVDYSVLVFDETVHSKEDDLCVLSIPLKAIKTDSDEENISADVLGTSLIVSIGGLGLILCGLEKNGYIYESILEDMKVNNSKFYYDYYSYSSKTGLLFDDKVKIIVYLHQSQNSKDSKYIVKIARSSQDT